MPPIVDATRAHRLTRPPGILFNVTALAMFVAAVWRGSERSGVLDSILLIAAAWFFVLLAWLFRLVAGAGARMITVRSVGRWILAPVLFVLAGVLVLSDGAMDARFALSRGALDEAADAALAGREVPAGWVGLYPVRNVLVEGGTVSFLIDGQYAFVRDPPGGSDSVVWYEPMGGGWSMEIVAFSGD